MDLHAALSFMATWLLLAACVPGVWHRKKDPLKKAVQRVAASVKK